MAGVNKVILLGRIGQDPEVRSLPNGAKVANFSIATSDNYTNKEGVRVEQTEWHRIELWDNLANIAEQYVRKGEQLYVEGRIRTEEYTDKDGIARKAVKIRGTAMTLVSSKPTGSGGDGSEAATQTAPRPAPAPAPSPAPEFDAPTEGDDNLPF
jgi:single-strand DNA-binding protein